MRHRRDLLLSLAGGLGLAGAIFAAALPASPVLDALSFRDDFESGNLSDWQLPFPEDWVILPEGRNHFLHMLRSRAPGVPRRPRQFARLKQIKVGSFDFRARLRREGRSMIIVFNYVDTMHFYYAHLSGDRGRDQSVHNGIFIVNGEPRKRIAGLDAPPALPDRVWHSARVLRDVSSGSIDVFMDRESQPLFSVVDRTFTCGQVGVGSFDETGDFDDVELASSDPRCKPGSEVRPASAKCVRQDQPGVQQGTLRPAVAALYTHRHKLATVIRCSAARSLP